MSDESHIFSIIATGEVGEVRRTIKVVIDTIEPAQKIYYWRVD
jgi:hypothetical protein